MANTQGKADHAAANTTIPGLGVERTKAIVLLLVQLFSVVQTGLTLAGVSQLPFTTDDVSAAITGVIAVVSSVYAWWRNNNLTGAAMQGEQLTKSIKTGTIAATQGTDAIKTSVLPADSLEALYDKDDNGDTVVDEVTGTPLISVR